MTMVPIAKRVSTIFPSKFHKWEIRRAVLCKFRHIDHLTRCDNRNKMFLKIRLDAFAFIRVSVELLHRCIQRWSRIDGIVFQLGADRNYLPFRLLGESSRIEENDRSLPDYRLLKVLLQLMMLLLLSSKVVVELDENVTCFLIQRNLWGLLNDKNRNQ